MLDIIIKIGKQVSSKIFLNGMHHVSSNYRNRRTRASSKQQSIETYKIEYCSSTLVEKEYRNGKVDQSEKVPSIALNTSQIMISLPEEDKATIPTSYSQSRIVQNLRNQKGYALDMKPRYTQYTQQKKIKSDPLPRINRESRSPKQLRLEMGLDRKSPRALSQFVHNSNLNLRQTFIPQKISADKNVSNQKRYQAGLSVISEKSGFMAESIKVDPRASVSTIRNSTGVKMGPKISHEIKLPSIKDIDSPRNLE